MNTKLFLMIILQKNYIGNNYFQMKFFHLLKRKKNKSPKNNNETF